MLTNRVLSAEEAQEWGIVTYVCDGEQLDVEVEKLASKLASGPTRAYGAVKQLLARTYDQSLEVQLEQESRLIAEMADQKMDEKDLMLFLTSGNRILRAIKPFNQLKRSILSNSSS